MVWAILLPQRRGVAEERRGRPGKIARSHGAGSKSKPERAGETETRIKNCLLARRGDRCSRGGRGPICEENFPQRRQGAKMKNCLWGTTGQPGVLRGGRGRTVEGNLSHRRWGTKRRMGCRHETVCRLCAFTRESGRSKVPPNRSPGERVEECSGDQDARGASRPISGNGQTHEVPGGVDRKQCDREPTRPSSAPEHGNAAGQRTGSESEQQDSGNSTDGAEGRLGGRVQFPQSIEQRIGIEQRDSDHRRNHCRGEKERRHDGYGSRSPMGFHCVHYAPRVPARLPPG